MVQTIGRFVALLSIAACGAQDVTSSTSTQDPDLTGRYQSGLGIVITDSVLHASGWGDGLSYGVLLSVDCPSEWILSQTRPREYAVTIRIVADTCYDNWGHVADYLTLAPTFTGILHIQTVSGNPLTVESLGTITVGTGSAQDFETLTGCSASGLGGGWTMSFQAYTTPDHTFENGWAYFMPRVPSTVQGQGPFRAQCRETGGLFMNLGFNFLKLVG
jgi:hypothetical protein